MSWWIEPATHTCAACQEKQFPQGTWQVGCDMRQRTVINGSVDVSVAEYRSEYIETATTAKKWFHEGLTTGARDAVVSSCVDGQSSFIAHPVFFLQRYDHT
jgi:hypothetical protein